MLTYHGIVQNGVVVIENGVSLPEGARVSVAFAASAGDETANNAVDPNETIGQKMARIAKKYANRPTNMPTDLAENHDHYLHGMPKRS